MFVVSLPLPVLLVVAVAARLGGLLEGRVVAVISQ